MREYELEVLEQYEIEVKGTRKIRGAFFCEAKEGTMLLRGRCLRQTRALTVYRPSQFGGGRLFPCGYSHF